ncbi:HAMP domain-containing sensor histidine kinase [Alloyangia pacifica]|uniref:histidine kinase n=1 Tax=Alloyangia pacifica TaxID=311180 RepID=A0A1I6WGW5_9RHOB|nr:HAMP domain-containing sensor histidine kinase [Alloyangia pacifica]MCA0998615.1 HAMP domain-containing histidine kinase [Alloyangia pacifica]SDI74636.1 Signal transduction histidine kinase [Alloyangia pacifica]SFT25228.1 Signal transduction histidine kinase [Alloyangia pacifica]
MTRFRSTPLRLSVVLIAVFTVFISVGLGIAYVIMHQALGAEIALRADQTIEEIRAIPETEERLERAGEIAAAADTRALLIRLELDGETIANIGGDLPEGIVGDDDIDLPEPVADSYLVRHTDLEPGRLTVAVGRDSVSELQETFVAILGFALLPALMLTSAIGIVVVRRTTARVEAIRSTLHELSEGTLAARVGAPHPDTDFGDISRDLDRMAEAQEAAVGALRQIGADIAHDLKTPIQRVAVRLERLGESDLPEPARQHLDQASTETAQIIATFQSLLQIAQLEGGQGREAFTSVDLGALLEDMAEIYGPSAEDAGATLTCSVSGPFPVSGDRHLLSRLVANLIENALRHAPGTEIALSLTGRMLTVRDGGPGIPAGQRDYVLRRLARLEASRSTPGSGLGLALVKAIADLHGAELTLGDAQPGLLVTVTFPG